jgi:hypothetical protein
MTRDDIIRMAHEAYCSRVNLHTDQKASISRLMRFAALVAAAEREACAKLCDKDTNPNTDKYEPVSQYQSGCYITAEYLAAAIRARGQE